MKHRVEARDLRRAKVTTPGAFYESKRDRNVYRREMNASLQFRHYFWRDALMAQEARSAVNYAVTDSTRADGRQFGEPLRCPIHCLSFRCETQALGAKRATLRIVQFKTAAHPANPVCQAIELKLLVAILLSVKSELQ